MTIEEIIKNTIREAVREEFAKYFPGRNEEITMEGYISEEALMRKLGNPHPSTRWRWRKNGQLPEPKRFGNTFLYKVSDIENRMKKK